MKFEELSQSAQKSYGNFNIGMGLAGDESTHEAISALENYDGTIVYSSDPAVSHIPPKIISVANIAQFKAMVGVPDHVADDLFEIPAQLDAPLMSMISEATDHKTLSESLSFEQIKTIKDVATIYTLSNSERVKEYETIINKVAFPGKVAYFASPDDHIVDKPIVILGPDPVVWNYPNIIIKPGGSISVQTEFRINCSKYITEESPSLAAEVGGVDKKISCTFPDYPTPGTPGQDAGIGKKGDRGTDGKEHKDNNTKGCPWVCDNAAGDGGQGKVGGTGTDATPGGNDGLDQKPFYMTVRDIITGNLYVYAGGGNGQDGGKGGNGGPGGPGGDPGTPNTHACTAAAKTGPQGQGGPGGKGGKAGNGGKGNIVLILYASIEGDTQGINVGGKAGNVGGGGKYGAGNPDGDPGHNGDKGTDGTAAQFTIKPAPPNLF